MAEKFRFNEDDGIQEQTKKLNALAGLTADTIGPKGDNGVDGVYIGDPADSFYSLQLSATSTAITQEPLTVDLPIQVEFGIAQTTDFVDIDILGTLTFKQVGLAKIKTVLHWGRTGGTGESKLFGRYVLNGNQLGHTLYAEIDNARTVSPFNSEFEMPVAIGDTITLEIMRDSTGHDSGGLFSFTPTLVGWHEAHTALINISKKIV